MTTNDNNMLHGTSKDQLYSLVQMVKVFLQDIRMFEIKQAGVQSYRNHLDLLVQMLKNRINRSNLTSTSEGRISLIDKTCTLHFMLKRLALL